MLKKSNLRIVALVVFALMLFVFVAGCQQQDAAPADDAADDTAAEDTADDAADDAADDVVVEGSTDQEDIQVTEESYSIAFAHKSLNYYAFVAMLESTKRACEDRGWTFDSAISDFDSSVQTNQIRTYIDSGEYDAIISDPIDSEGIIEVFDQAKDAGLAVGVIDTPTTGGDIDFTIAFDNFQAGQLAAQTIVDTIMANNGGKEEGVILNPYGAMSSFAWRLRKEGFDDVMAKYPGFTFEAVPAEGDSKKTNDAVVNTLTKYGQIDGCSAPSDNPGLGAVEAFKANNMWKKVGEEGHVVFVTIDGEPCAMQGIEDGYYDATVAQDVICYGEICIEMFEKYVFKGEPCPTSGTYKNDRYFWEEAPFSEEACGSYLMPPAYVIDSSNVDDDRHWGNIAWDEYGLRYE